MGLYATWWSDRLKTKDLRELILHYPFFKPSRARLNLLVGIFDAWRSFDQNDTRPLFKKILKEVEGSLWLGNMTVVVNQIIIDFFEYKGAYYLEEFVMLALTSLLKKSGMKDMYVVATHYSILFYFLFSFINC